MTFLNWTNGLTNCSSRFSDLTAAEHCLLAVPRRLGQYGLLERFVDVCI